MTTAYTDTAAKLEALRNQLRAILNMYNLSGDEAKEWIAAALDDSMPAPTRAADAHATTVLLAQAEGFISGFENDAEQDGVNALLADLRAAVASGLAATEFTPQKNRWHLALAICEGIPDAPLAAMAEKPGALVRIMEAVKGVQGASSDILNAASGIDARTLLGDNMTVRGDVIDALRRCEVALVDTAPEHAAYREETLRFVRSVLMAHRTPLVGGEELPSAPTSADALMPLCDEATDAIERLRDMLAAGRAFVGGFSAVPPAGVPVDTLEVDIATAGVSAAPSREGCECAHHLFAVTANGGDDGTGDLWRQYIVSRPGDSVDEAEAAARDAVQAEVPAGFRVCGASYMGCVDREVCVMVANYAD
jgi:hypothetical protein